MLLQDKFPQLKTQWHPNNTIPFNTITTGSRYQALWIGECGHEWQTRISTTAQHHNPNTKLPCPYCTNRKILPGYNDLTTTHPEIAAQWHPTRNGNQTPQTVTAGSSKKVWWKCEKGHEWQASIVNRKNGTKCPECYKQSRPKPSHTPKPQPRNPIPQQIAKEWDPQKNNIQLTTITSGSGKKVWWKCEKGHEWQATPTKRTYYNTRCPYCTNRKVLPGYNDLATTNPQLAAEWHPTRNKELNTNQVTYGSKKQFWWVCEKGHEWQASVQKRTAGLHCKICYQSKPEHELQKFIQTLGQTPITNIRSIIPPYELDIYIPARNLAIEYNGLYWHSEANGKGKTYHYDKWKACQEKGIQLIQVWEDDWNRNPELIKTMLAHKLGVSGKSKVYARSTHVRELTKVETDTFLEQYHIQGSVDGGVRIGLVQGVGDIEKLVAVMVLKTEPGTGGKSLNLLRFATSLPVPGGFTKLLKYVERTYAPESIITFSDNAVSDGGLYSRNGFMPVKALKPDYMYVVNNKRVHKFNYRLKRFRNDPDLQYVEGLSERELAQLNNLPRVWDAGKIRWERVRA